MNMIVCIKQVIDPEAPPDKFKIDNSTNKAVLSQDVSPVIDPYAEYAMEAALKIRDIQGGKITAVSLGINQSRAVVKKSLAVGVDELVMLEDDAFDDGDSWSTAYALAMSIKKLGGYDIIFCGREASDTNAGQVGPGIAEILGLPCVTLVKKIDVTEGKAKVERITDEGSEINEISLPAVVTISNEIGELRYPSVKGMFAAGKKKPTIWNPADIGVEPTETGAAGRRTSMLKLFQPVKEVNCEIVEGESDEEAGTNLALKLRGAKVL